MIRTYKYYFNKPILDYLTILSTLFRIANIL